MEELLNIISEKELESILKSEESIKDLTKEEILEKILVLKKYNCDNSEIQNIIVSNPKYLIREAEDVLKTLQKLNDLGIQSINLLIDSNPFILNKAVFEIENYINNELSNEKELDQVIQEIEENSWILNEV